MRELLADNLRVRGQILLKKLANAPICLRIFAHLLPDFEVLQNFSWFCVPSLQLEELPGHVLDLQGCGCQVISNPLLPLPHGHFISAFVLALDCVVRLDL